MTKYQIEGMHHFLKFLTILNINLASEGKNIKFLISNLNLTCERKKYKFGMWEKNIEKYKFDTWEKHINFVRSKERWWIK